ncbi:ribonuclease P protein component 3 [Methanobacterium sp.]|uniref:ribonuclease P protein component 3 n=1 Tax=Methanobacterium sp. TaxID=2164 RepID=UPI003C71FFBA
MFFDFHVHNIQLADEAKRLGYNGIAFIQSSRNYNKSDNITHAKDNFNIWSGVEIYAKNPDDLRKKVQKFREHDDIIIVNGGDIKVNRAACEDPRVDILAHPYKNRRDSGINHILAKKASENNVAIELSINSIIKARLSLRAKILSHFRQILKLQRKFKFPLIITSNAYSIYDLRTPEDIIAFAGCLEMTHDEIISSLSKNPRDIIERSRIRKNIIVQGARTIE